MPKRYDKNADSLASIASIKEKRLLLKRVVMITRATERMQDSLKSVLILGQPSSGIPEGVLKYYHVLSNKIKAKPTEKIQWYQTKLEELIQANLQGIFAIALLDHDAPESMSASEQMEEAYSDDAMNLLTEFKRQSQTAVALKILLQQRGIYTSGTAVKIPVQQIKRHIKQLEEREKTQRKKLQTHITDMYTDLSYMLNSEQYSDDMKRVFRTVMAELEGDLKAIAQGSRIDQIQLSFEVVETGEVRKTDPVAVQQKVVAETEEYLEDIEQSESVADRPKNRGFLRILFKWLNTPWSVSWGDIKKGKDR